MKWSKPIYYAIDGFTYDTDRIARAEAMLGRIASIAGIDTQKVKHASAANLVMTFHNVESFRLPTASKPFCYVQPGYTRAGEFTRVTLHLNLAPTQSFYGLTSQVTPEYCIAHELMHAFGFHGHPHTTDSVLSYAMLRIVDPTEADELLLRTLYDQRLKPGTLRLPALQQAHVIMSELRRQKYPEEQLPARPLYFDQLIARLQQDAEAGDHYAMIVLAQGYRHGALLPQDISLGNDLIERAAALGNAAARADIAAVFREGIDIPADKPRAAELSRWAAERGSSRGQYEYGRQLFDGDGIPSDRVEGLKWIILAAQSGTPWYEYQRKLYWGAALPHVRQAALQRAEAWKSKSSAAR